MTANLPFLAMTSVLLGFAACGGDAFTSNDPGGQPTAGKGGSQNRAGTSSTAGSAEPGDGGAPVGSGGSESGGSTPAGGSAQAAGGDDQSDAGSGSAGEPAGPSEPIFTISQLLDDMEDGNQTLLESNGDWYVFKDMSAGMIEPAAGAPFTMSALSPARAGSTQAVKVTVADFTGWGAACGFDFAYLNGVRQSRDLEDFLAIRFWAKASKSTSVKLQVPNGDTDPLGGKCDGTDDNACFAHFTKSFTVGTEWRQVTVLFSDLRQEASGRQAPSFDQHQVYSVFFVLGPNQAVSLWIDDVALAR